MAEKRPLTVYGTKVKQLAVGDTLPSAGNPVIIKDEGIVKTSAVTEMNFTGAGVEATNVGNVVTVNVAGGGGGGNFGKVLLIKPGQNAVQYTTIALAGAAATAGDTILVFAGIYNENNINVKNVYYYFFPGAIVDYNGADLTPIINPTGSAATDVFSIFGKGQFISRSPSGLATDPSAPVLSATLLSGGATANVNALLFHQKGNNVCFSSGSSSFFVDIENLISESPDYPALATNIYAGATFVFKHIKANSISGVAMALSSVAGITNILCDSIFSNGKGIVYVAASGVSTINIKYNSLISTGNSIQMDPSAGSGTLNVEGSTKSTSGFGIIPIGTMNYKGELETITNTALNLNYYGGLFSVNGVLKKTLGLSSTPLISLSCGIPAKIFLSGALNCDKGNIVLQGYYTEGAVYNKARINHTDATVNAIEMGATVNKLILQEGTEIITAGANSVNGTGQIVVYGGVSNKPVLGVLQNVSTLLVHPTNVI